MTPLRVALAGCGAVGSAFVDLVQERNAVAGRRPIDVVRVLVRDRHRRRKVLLPADRFTDDLDDFLSTPADAVVEAVGGIEPMLTLARRAMGEGRDWVTANKALVAVHGPALAEVARRAGVGFGTEAAVGAGVPIVATIRHALSESGIVGIRGILNGTTNYMLSSLESGAEWEGALADARARGFAEADPSRDLEGLDAADKIRVLSWLAFGVEPESLDLDVLTIPVPPAALLADAPHWNASLRQVAEVRRSEGRLHAVVAPTFVARGSALAGTRFEGNLVEIETAYAGVLRLSGPGAGGRATASALLADLVGRRPAPDPVSPSSSPGGSGDWRWAFGLEGGAGALRRLEHEAAGTGIEVRGRVRRSGRVQAAVGPAGVERVRALAERLAEGGDAPSVARLGEGCVLPPTASRPQSAVSPFTPSETFP